MRAVAVLSFGKAIVVAFQNNISNLDFGALSPISRAEPKPFHPFKSA